MCASRAARAARAAARICRRWVCASLSYKLGCTTGRGGSGCSGAYATSYVLQFNQAEDVSASDESQGHRKYATKFLNMCRTNLVNVLQHKGKDGALCVLLQ